MSSVAIPEDELNEFMTDEIEEGLETLSISRLLGILSEDESADGESVKSRNVVRRSWVYEWGTDEGQFWRCLLCTERKTTFSNKGTSHIAKHLRNIHQKSDSKLAKLPTIKASPITKKTSSNQSRLFSHRQLDRKKVIELVVKWTIRSQQLFIAVESQDF
jgi:hypothetical protein